LMYHKVDLLARTQWWVSADAFERQLSDLGDRQFVLLDDYDPGNPDHVCVTFDGVYENVLEYAARPMRERGVPFEVFITSDYIGRGNEFDASEPYAKFCNREQLSKLTAMGGRLQWHTRSHRDLCALSDEELAYELTIPDDVRALDPGGFTWFAYPYGRCSDRIRTAVSRNFRGAVACDSGAPEDLFRLPRLTVLDSMRLNRRRVSVVVPCYNYGNYLLEAVQSLLSQTYPPDEILISDDASTDDTPIISEHARSLAPELIKVHRNDENMGIVNHFNAAVRKTSGDYVCLLGADNRFRSDFLQRTVDALDHNPKVAIAYTNFALFGPRAPLYYSSFPEQRRAGQLGKSLFLIAFPEFEAVSEEEYSRINFMHGSSLYRRSAFDHVGGYIDRVNGPEDHQLFLRMLKQGWKAKLVPLPLLEYRQHSSEQANHVQISAARLEFYRKRYEDTHAAFLKFRDEASASFANLTQECDARRQWSEKLQKDIDQLKGDIDVKVRNSEKLRLKIDVLVAALSGLSSRIAAELLDVEARATHMRTVQNDLLSLRKEILDT
jgi:glycosyltransferase involved in cell wall biosynthesis